jgi:alanyl-tRNA synthetase
MGGYSMELCGGTHVSNTGRIGSVKLLGESSVASGVRRIEAVCGKKTLQRIEELENTVVTVADSLKSTPANVVFRAGQVMNELKEVQREKEALAGKLSALRAGELLNNVKQVGAVRLLTAKVDAADSDALRALTDSLRDKDAALVCVLAMVNAEGKINFAAACGKEAVACGAHAGNLLKAAAKTCGGGGGGRPDSATAGGRDVSKLEQALAEVETTLSQMLK